MGNRLRRRLRWIGAGVVLAAAGGWAGPPPADPPQEVRPPAPPGFPKEVEEPLPPDRSKAKPVEFLDDEDGPAAGRAPKGAAYYPLKDLTRAAAAAKHPGIKAVLNKFALA